MQLDSDYKVLQTTPSAEIMAYDVGTIAWNSVVKQFSMHADSFSYQILKTDFKSVDAEVVRHNVGEAFAELVMAEVAKLEAELNATAKMAVALKLPAGGQIKPHADTSALFQSAHRCHLALKTNAECLFVFGANSYHFPAGEWREISNTQEHSFTNGGMTDRVHLVVDLIPNA